MARPRRALIDWLKGGRRHTLAISVNVSAGIPAKNRALAGMGAIAVFSDVFECRSTLILYPAADSINGCGDAANAV